MAKVVAKQAAQLRKERMAKWSLLVETAIDLGQTTKTELAESAGIKLWELADLFKFNPVLYAKYCIRRRTLVDTASDNLEMILKDPTHPQHFQASKYVLEKYKSDLDTNLEAKEDSKQGGVNVLIGGAGKKASPVRITFSDNKKK